jgi:hypothetical protein
MTRATELSRSHMSQGCEPCTEYLAARLPVLHPFIGRRAVTDGSTKRVVLWDYMTRVHRRHLAGLPLAAGSYVPGRGGRP